MKTVAWVGGCALLAAACCGCQTRRAAPVPEPAPAAPVVRLAAPGPPATTRPSAETSVASADSVPVTAAPTVAAPPPPPPPPTSIQPPTGRQCRVLLRRDALGSASPAPLGVQSPSPASRAAELTGTIDQISDDWLVLRAGGRLWWFPRSVILAIDFPDAP